MLRTIALAVVALGLSTAGYAAPPSAPLMSRQIAPDFRLEQIAANVYAFISNNTLHEWEDGNTTVIVTPDGVVVVDASTTYLSTRHLAEIRKLTDKPVKYVINTHFHRDHLLGNHVYKDAFPNVQVVQDRYTAMLADRRDPAILDIFFKGQGGADLLAGYKKSAETGKDADGNPLTGYALVRAKAAYGEFAPVYVAGRAGRYVPADITFDEQMTIRLGGEEIQLIRMAGHTRGDTVVYLPKEKILAAGDLLIDPVPFGINDLNTEWGESLNRLIAIKADIIVPGHGEVEFGDGFMTLQRDLNKSLMDQAAAAVAKHHSVEEFKKEIDLSVFKTKIAGDDPERLWGWDEYFIANAVDRAWAIAHGDL